MDIDTKAFRDATGLSFDDHSLLLQAFTHRSYLNEHREIAAEHNERLEFLGDAVLELIVTDFLFRKFPAGTEGDLTAYRAALVNTTTLSSVAARLSLNDFLFLSRGEAKDTGRARQYILANTFEALVGALYLDQGYEAARAFVAESLLPLTDEIIAEGRWQDAKSAFQERAQEKTGATPLYRTLKEEGPDHEKEFTVGVFLRDELVAEGRGPSKQDAEQEAARAALRKKGW